MKNLKKSFIFISLFLLPLVAKAQISNWEIVPNESNLSFTATQNNAPVTGQFKVFTGEIKGDPAKPETCSIKIVVDINSVFDVYNQLSDTLKSAPWFNAKLYPQAVFQSNQCVKTGDKTYQATGNLTIRDKTVPVTLQFTEEENTGTKGKIKGSTILKRTDFGVGSGEWADTTAVKDEVKVDFVVSAIRK